MQIQKTSTTNTTFTARLKGVEELTRHYRASDYKELKTYVKALKKAGDDDTIIHFAMGEFNNCFGELRIRISNKKFGDEVCYKAEKLPSLTPNNCLYYAMQDNFGRIIPSNVEKYGNYDTYSFNKLESRVNSFELFFLHNLCEKHNLSPQEVLKKYKINDPHWSIIAKKIENSKLYTKDKCCKNFYPEYGNTDLVVEHDEALKDILNIINSRITQ